MYTQGSRKVRAVGYNVKVVFHIGWPLAQTGGFESF